MKLNALVNTLVLMPLLLPGCTEPEYTATAIVAVQSPMPGSGDGPVPEYEVRKQAALLTSLSTIRKTVEGKRFQHWAFYHGNTAEQVARQLLPRLRTRILPETNLIEFSCVHPDRDLAHRIVNSIVGAVIEEQRLEAANALLMPMEAWLRERAVLHSHVAALTDSFRTGHPEFPTHRERLLEFDRLRQSLLTWSGKQDELTMAIATAAPLAKAIDRALAEGGPGLSSLYGHPDLTRLTEVRDLTVNLNTATAELESHQEYLVPEHPQVQAAMLRVSELTARLTLLRDTWLLGKKADFNALVAQREQVREMQSEVAAAARRLAEVMSAYDAAEKQKLAYEQRLAIIDARIEELENQAEQVRARIALIEPAVRPRSHD